MALPPERDRCILIVEDDELIRRAMQMVLEWEGYRIVSAGNGQEALDLLHDGLRPCLIVLDVMMPVLDGRQFRRQQLLDPSLADIPVIVVSAAHFAEAVSAARHLRKPFAVEELLDAIRDQVGEGAASFPRRDL